MTPHARIFITAMSVATLLAGAAPKAESQDLRTVIPFEFKAAGTTLHAGTYMLTPVFGTANAFELRSVHGGTIFMTGPSERGGKVNAAQLTFNRYGERYFLSSIRFSRDRAYTMHRTTEERELVKTQAAGRTVRPTVVTIAAHR
jgi:hypothetical protein